jgi:U4/U6.U5 tri-snRNP component SNU23
MCLPCCCVPCPDGVQVKSRLEQHKAKQAEVRPDDYLPDGIDRRMAEREAAEERAKQERKERKKEAKRAAAAADDEEADEDMMALMGFGGFGGSKKQS